jgi:hypothetical protein
LNARLKYLAGHSALALRTSKNLHRPFVTRRKSMTRLTFVSAALIAASVYQTQAAAARDTAPVRRAATHATADCVRAPAVGAYATAPYKEPPCMPKTMN